MDKRKIWTEWEKIAIKHLTNLWYKLLTKNYYKPFWEIDLIFKDWEEVVFVEVKMRYSDLYWEGFEAVTKSKLKKLYKAGQMYALENGLDIDYCRFDVVSIMKTRGGADIEHFKKVM